MDVDGRRSVRWRVSPSGVVQIKLVAWMTDLLGCRWRDQIVGSEFFVPRSIRAASRACRAGGASECDGGIRRREPGLGIGFCDWRDARSRGEDGADEREDSARALCELGGLLSSAARRLHLLSYLCINLLLTLDACVVWTIVCFMEAEMG